MISVSVAGGNEQDGEFKGGKRQKALVPSVATTITGLEDDLNDQR